MSMRFKTKNRVPPADGFTFHHPETGHVSTAMRYWTWLGAINDHRSANGLPPVTPEEAEWSNCAGLAPAARLEFCADPDMGTIQTIGLTLNDIVRGTMTVAHFKLTDGKLVAPQEAERRAAICEHCPYNVPYRSACGSDCKGLVDLVNGLVGAQKTSKDQALNGCAVCHCKLSAKVWLPVDALRKFEPSEIQEKYPKDFCWMSVAQDAVPA